MNPQLLQNLTMLLMKQNPQIQNNSMAMNMLSVIQKGDAKRGEEIANNLCQAYGTTREQATQMARQFFGI